MFRSTSFRAVCVIFAGLGASVGSAQEVGSLLSRIKAVGKEGAGNTEAASAWRELVRKGPDVLPDILAGIDDATPRAINWLRPAVEAIQDRAMRDGQPMPVAKLETFLRDTRHSSPARRLAFECLVRLDPTAPQRFLPGMLDDPSLELRRDAVALKLQHGMTASFDTPLAKKQYYKELLNHARDRDQVSAIGAQLNKLGDKIDLTSHFGFVTRWLLAGPFDNAKGVKFYDPYPPEKGVDIGTEYAGKKGQQIRWKEHIPTKQLGLVDLNDAVGKLKGATAYAYAVLSSDTERPVELRAGTGNAIRIWLNGKELYAREEYHHGMAMDQHVGKGVLRKGRNEILIKVCQNEQTESWAEQWNFQMRVCDPLGAAVPVTNTTGKSK